MGMKPPHFHGMGTAPQPCRPGFFTMDRDRDDDRMPLRREELTALLRAHAAQLLDRG